MSDTLSKDDRWAIGQALEILFFAGKTENQCKAINNLLDLVDRQTYKLHKADGMANEVNILTKENRALTAELKELREFVGAMNRVAIEEWHGHWLRTDEPQFAFYDSDGECVAIGTDPFDAWRKMNAGEGE